VKNVSNRSGILVEEASIPASYKDVLNNNNNNNNNTVLIQFFIYLHADLTVQKQITK
jgi:hypothetical protein